MKLLKKMRRQWAVYWGPNGTDAYGKVKYLPPVSIKVRWVDTTELFMNMKTGQEQVAKSHVFFGPIDSDRNDLDIKEQGVLWLGPNNGLDKDPPLDDMDQDHQDNPFKNPKAFAVVRIDFIPTLKADDFVRKAYL